MQTKWIGVVVFLSSCWLNVQAQSKVVATQIEKVTVFFDGAQIIRKAKVSLVSGRTELVFRGLSPQLTKESIQISVDNSVLVHSVVHQQSSQAESGKSEELANFRKQKQAITEKIASEKVNLKIYQREEEMLLKNQSIASQASGVRVVDLKESLDFQRVRMQDVLNKQLDVNRLIQKYEEEIKRLNQKMTEIEQSKDIRLSEVLVEVSTKELKIDTELTCTYFVPNAGWVPQYEAKVSSIEKPIEMLYKAKVYQYSGEDWRNIRLSLSNATPKRRGASPKLKTWYWGSKNDYSDYFESLTIKPTGLTQISGVVLDAKTKMPIQGASVTIKGTSLGVSTNENGFYRLAIPPDLKSKSIFAVFSSVGYVRVEHPINQTVIDIDLQEDAKLLQEVVVSGYVLSEKEEFTSVLQGQVKGISLDKIQTKRSLVEETEAPVSQEFELLQPYTILSDGKEYQVDLKSLEMPAQFEYYCVPKIDADVFLTAKVLGWDQFNLLPGEVSLFFEGTYIGKSSLDLSNQDTLSLSLGRDKSVLVSRTKQKDFQKKQLVGSNKIDTFSYLISIRNTRSSSISMVIEDQYPLSRYKAVEIYEQEAPDAELNKETGKLTWRLKLEPSREKKLTFKYTVKYPKGSFSE